MIRRTITEADLRRRITSVLAAVQRGEYVTVTRDGEVVAQLIPPGSARPIVHEYVVQKQPPPPGVPSQGGVPSQVAAIAPALVAPAVPEPVAAVAPELAAAAARVRLRPKEADEPVQLVRSDPARDARPTPVPEHRTSTMQELWVVPAADGWATPDDIEPLLNSIKARRQELVAVMESSRLMHDERDPDDVERGAHLRDVAV